MKTKKIKICLLSILLLITSGIGIYAEDDNSSKEPPQGENGDMPEKPDGEAPGDMSGGGTPPEKPDGEGFGGGANTQTFDYSGSYSGTLTADGEEVSSSDETIEATDSDQNAALVENAGTLTIDGSTLNKSGDDDNGDNCNFYGLNSIALAVNENSLLKISNSTLNSTSEGSNAIFATDSSKVYSYNNTISTSSDNSRGLDATYSGTIIADSMNISTQGNHSASVATDRGGGNISITNSTLSTAGSGSPLLYSTGDIEADNVTGTSSGSQIAGMEGLNTILIYNSNLASTNNAITGSDPIKNGVIIYQSTSGDAETSTGDLARFEAVNSTLTTSIDSGSMFYLTNTSANVLLSNTTLNFDSTNVNLLQVEGNDANSWGKAGSNGASVNFTCLNETLSGNITVDSISSANIYLMNGTTYTGATSITENAVNTNQTDENITMNISSDSKWIVMGDSTVTNLNVEDGGQIVDEDGKNVTIKVNDEIIAEGDSEYTITVTGSYNTTVVTDSNNELTTNYIDRSEFDEVYNLSTTFNSNSNVVDETVDTTATTTTASTANTGSYYVVGIIAVAILMLVVYFIVQKKK